MTHAPPMQRCLAGMGRTFQIPQPFERLTAYENLLVAGAFGTRQAEAHVVDLCADILVETGLIAKANVPAGSFPFLSANDWSLRARSPRNPSFCFSTRSLED